MLIVAVVSRLRFFQASQRAMVGRMLHTCSSPTSLRLTAAAAMATATSFASQRQVAACMPSYPFTAGELDQSKTPIMQFKRRVKLNVGGDKFETTLSTLTRQPDSTLAVMFSGRHEVPQDDDGYVFIDRDGTHFRTILNFLRTGVLDLPKSQKAANELTRELQYYQLDTCADAGALSTTAALSGSFELVESYVAVDKFPWIDAVGPTHTQSVQARLQANPSLKVVNSFVTHAHSTTTGLEYLYVYTALAA